MDPEYWKTTSYVVVFVGTSLVLAGSIGTWYFGNLAEKQAPFTRPIRTASSPPPFSMIYPGKISGLPKYGQVKVWV